MPIYWSSIYQTQLPDKTILCWKTPPIAPYSGLTFPRFYWNCLPALPGLGPLPLFPSQLKCRAVPISLLIVHSVQQQPIIEHFPPRRAAAVNSQEQHSLRSRGTWLHSALTGCPTDLGSVLFIRLSTVTGGEVVKNNEMWRVPDESWFSGYDAAASTSKKFLNPYSWQPWNPLLKTIHGIWICTVKKWEPH